MPGTYATIPGRKTDVKDCRGLHGSTASGVMVLFRPGMICRIASLRAIRRIWSRGGAENQHYAKGCSKRNLHLSSRRFSSTTGVTVWRILDAILAGKADASQLAKLRDIGFTRAPLRRWKAALVGDYRRESLRVGQSSRLPLLPGSNPRVRR